MKISEKNTKSEISPEPPNRTGQKSKSVSTNTPSNIIQLRANGTFGRQCPRSGEGCRQEVDHGFVEMGCVLPGGTTRPMGMFMFCLH